MTTRIECTRCHGEGWHDGERGLKQQCGTCWGAGSVPEKQMDEFKVLLDSIAAVVFDLDPAKREAYAPHAIPREIAMLKARIVELEAFKSYGHERLDGMGVPKEFPDGEHSKHGCRIGDRLDWVRDCIAALRNAVATQHADLEHRDGRIAERESELAATKRTLHTGVRSTARNRKRSEPTAWGSIANTFGLGSTFSCSLCIEAGIDPTSGEKITDTSGSMTSR